MLFENVGKYLQNSEPFIVWQAEEEKKMQDRNQCQRKGNWRREEEAGSERPNIYL